MYTSDSFENANLSSQVRTNALSSYFFLGFLYLLAYRNPNFSHPFVRAHAWAATRLHAFCLGFFVLYQLLLAELLSYYIPFLGIPLSRIVFSAVFLFLLSLMLRGAYLAHQGQKFGGFGIQFGATDPETLDRETIRSEAELVRTLLSFAPVIGVFVAERFQTPVTAVGAKVSGYATALLILEFVFLRGESLLMVTAFFLIVLVVTVGAFLGSGRGVAFLAPIQRFPGILDIQAFLKATPSYLVDVFFVVIGKREELNFAREYERAITRIQKTEQELDAFFTDGQSAISPYLIYVPVLNLLFLYRFFSPNKSRYVLAINQGIVLTVIMLLLGYAYGDSAIMLLAVLPMMLGIAMVKSRPFLQIPLLYEIGAIASYVTFGIISGTKHTHEKSQEVREVRLKVE